MKKYLSFLLVLLILSSCKGQKKVEAERIVGGPCQDCEATLDYLKLNVNPKSIDTLSGFLNHEPKIKITGTVYKQDGKTPASDIILYVYHVNKKGVYQPSDTPFDWENIHGQYRGWLKTDINGKFTFFTFRPSSYPNSQEPEHIHIYVKEPNTIPYYIDSYLFESDPLLTIEEKQSQKNRGGSGILKLVFKNGIWTANRDIILGLNIPNY